jgi:hypothetical protein
MVDLASSGHSIVMLRKNNEWCILPEDGYQ